MNYIYPHGYQSQNGQQTSAHPANAYPQPNAHALVTAVPNGQPVNQTTQREPPMLTMCASDPEETGGPGCAVAGISRERMGACFKYTWVREWKYPLTEELLYVQQRLLDFLIQYGLRQADMCEALGLVTTYMSLFLKDVHSSNLGSRRRAEMYCVLNEFFHLIDEEAFDMEAIFRVRARRRHSDRCFRLPEEALLPQLPPDDPLDTSLDRPIPLFPGISRRHGGRLFKYTSVTDWRHPSVQECTELRDRILVLLNHAQVKPVDLADGLGLVAPYLVHFLSDPFHPLVGRKRRGELFSVITAYLCQLDNGTADIQHLQLLRDLRRASENTVRNSRAPAPVYKRTQNAANNNQNENKNTMQPVVRKPQDARPDLQNEMQAIAPPDPSNFGVMRATPITQNSSVIPQHPQPKMNSLQALNVPGLKMGTRSQGLQPLAEEGLTESEFSQLLANGVPNSVPLDVAFSNHLGKWLQPMSLGGGDPRTIPDLPADWRSTDLLFYQHPEGRNVPVPDGWNAGGAMKLHQECPPLHGLLQQENFRPPDHNDNLKTEQLPDDITANNPGLSEIWQWQRISQGLQLSSDPNNFQTDDIFPTAPSLPHWNPASDTQEYHLYRYLFTRWKEVISHACASYQTQARLSKPASDPNQKDVNDNTQHYQSDSNHHGLEGTDTGSVSAAMPTVDTTLPPTLKTNTSISLSDILPTNWNANQLTSSFLSYDMWIQNPLVEESVFSKWNERDAQFCENIGVFSENKIVPPKGQRFYTNMISKKADTPEFEHKSPIVPICMVLSPDPSIRNEKCPGDRPWEQSVLTSCPDINQVNSVLRKDNKRQTDIDTDEKGLFSTDTLSFIKCFYGESGEHEMIGKDAVHQLLTESCLLPHHEWMTASIGDPLSTIELLAETRIGHELGMAPAVVESAANKLRHQMLAMSKLFRCLRIAQNALQQMSKSGYVTTYAQAKRCEPAPSQTSDIISACSHLPIIVDVIIEDEQCRVKDLLIWDISSVAFNDFAAETVESIMTKSRADCPHYNSVSIGGASLITLLQAHQSVPIDKLTDNDGPAGPARKLPETVRNAVDLAVRRSMLTSIAEFCQHIHIIWRRYADNPFNKGITSLEKGAKNPSIGPNREDNYSLLIVEYPDIDFDFYMRRNDPNDVFEHVPYMMSQLYRYFVFMGKITIPSNYETFVYRLIGKPPPDSNMDSYARSESLINKYFRIGPIVISWDPYSSLRQNRKRILMNEERASRRIEQTDTTNLTASNREIQRSSPSAQSEEDEPKGPRRSTRVMAKQRENTTVSLREKLGLSSSDSSESDERPSRNRGRKYYDDSDVEEDWDESEGTDDDADIDEPIESDDSE